MAEKYNQVNVTLADDDMKALDHMMKADGFDNRSAFLRKLVRQEYARKFSQSNPLIMVDEAISASILE